MNVSNYTFWDDFALRDLYKLILGTLEVVAFVDLPGDTESLAADGADWFVLHWCLGLVNKEF